MALSGPSAHIVVVTEGGAHVWGLVNALAAAFGPIAVVIEEPLSKWTLLRRRAGRLGYVSAAGQFGTMAVIRIMKRFFPKLARRSIRATGLDTTPPRDERIIRIRSADGPELTAALASFRADVAVLAGCRILSAQTLAAVACPVINYHAGIAPLYRGVNGGYWALANNDADNFGSTVHLVDAGVDTGAVLYQARGSPLPGDTIATYPLTQMAFSRDIVIRAVEDALNGSLRPVETHLPSLQWYHPTLWSYLWTGLRRGVW